MQDLSPTVAAPSDANIYGRRFWLAYVANILIITANALTFRFADFVRFLIGTEHQQGTEHLSGQIVSWGLIGAILSRLILGPAIDRLGLRTTWSVSTIGYLAGTIIFLWADSVSWILYLARILYASGLSGMLTCSIVHVQALVPFNRRTEIIGNLGTSGFVGLVTGSLLADSVKSLIPDQHTFFHTLFSTVIFLALIYIFLVQLITSHNPDSTPQAGTVSWEIIRSCWPGWVIGVAMLLGSGFAITHVFFTRFADSRKLSNQWTFYTAYCLTAFAIRITTSNLSRSIGRHAMILAGLGGLLAGSLLLLPVSQSWHLIPAAITWGFGHALLYPSIVSLGTERFPVEYRGTGTNMILGFVDLGTILGAPALGWIIDHYNFNPTLLTLASVTAFSGIFYAIVSHDTRDPEMIS